jgi:hypothetical protein
MMRLPAASLQPVLGMPRLWVEATMYDTVLTRALVLMAIWIIALMPLFFM